MIFTTARKTLASLFAELASAGSPIGKAVFVGLFVLLLVWLVLMPRRLIGHTDAPLPAWRNARLWAIMIAVIEIAVYAYFG